MFKTLYAKMVLTLFILFALMGGVFVMSVMYSAQMYQQEASQRLNQDLAMYIATERVLMHDGKVNQDNLNDLFQQAMIINPALELYLLDAQGKVISHSSHLHGVVRDYVSLAPLNTFINTGHDAVILGDDPRSKNRQKAFSAAPIEANGKRQGYIYAVLGSERFDHVSEMLKQSYIMKWSATTIVVALLFAFVASLMVFFLLTRKLRMLGRMMQSFKSTDYTALPAPVLALDIKRPGDEIDQMAITFQQMAERIYRQLNRLKETDALRRELVANVSHDLRTPLSSLKGYLDTLLLKDHSLSAADRRKYLEIAQTNTNRLSRLVVELFELAKLDADELKPTCEAFSIAELLHDVAQKFELRATNSSIELHVDTASNTPYVYADVGMIERVLDNLLDNAFQHTPAGGAISIRTQVEQEQVLVMIADTGSGIDEHDLPHIFKRFYRQASEETGAAAGAGLGLAIAYRIVELHGSRLTVKSQLDAGTEFDFHLPLQVSV